MHKENTSYEIIVKPRPKSQTPKAQTINQTMNKTMNRTMNKTKIH